jgi:hypothetical protein
VRRERILILGGGLLLGVLLAAGLAQLRPGSDTAAANDPDESSTTTPVAAAGASPPEGVSEPTFFQRIFQREPETRTAPAGTLLGLRFLDSLSSHTSAAGETFRAEVTQEVSVDGGVVIPAASRVVGTVADAHSARKIGGRAILSLRFHTLELPDGSSVPIAASFASAGRSQAPRDAAIIGGSTLGGAILGEAIDEGQGGIIGAVVGGIAGAVGAKRTHGRPVEVPAGTVMSIELTEPVTVTVN